MRKLKHKEVNQLNITELVDANAGFELSPSEATDGNVRGSPPWEATLGHALPSRGTFC